jgi:hypothetical protein
MIKAPHRCGARAAPHLAPAALIVHTLPPAGDLRRPGWPGLIDGARDDSGRDSAWPQGSVWQTLLVGGPGAGHDALVDCWMEFFIAPDDEAAALVKGFGTGGAFESLPGGSYDPADAVVEWESLFTGASSPALVQSGEPRIVAEMLNDGCWTRWLAGGPTFVRMTARTSTRRKPSFTLVRWLPWPARP